MNINLSEIKKQLKRFTKIPSVAARHFWASLGLIFVISLIITAFFFYQYTVHLPQEIISGSHDPLQVERDSYERLMDLREQEKTKEKKSFPDLFKLSEEETEEESTE